MKRLPTAICQRRVPPRVCHVGGRWGVAWGWWTREGEDLIKRTDVDMRGCKMHIARPKHTSKQNILIEDQNVLRFQCIFSSDLSVLSDVLICS